MKRLSEFEGKKISLEELITLYRLDSYQQLYEKVLALIDKESLSPIKDSGLNGKHPALYKRYRIVTEQEDTTLFEEELTYQITPLLDTSYYLGHLKQYEKDREAILLLNAYLKKRKENINFVSLNERSFEIWGREKYLKQEGGLTLLKHLGLPLEALKVYETVTPVAYYAHHKKTPQNVLIIENMDTFYSMRQHLMSGQEEIAGYPIGTLVYGAGKQIVKGFGSFMTLGEAYLKDENNCFLYFGDLDYEGISIYESLKEKAEDLRPVCLFTLLYEKMLRKSEKMEIALPQMKEKQNKVPIDDFLSHFSAEESERIKGLLEEGDYIPQEILNISDF